MAAGDGRVVSNFIVQALRGEDITIYGDGSQTRSFCYVSDLIEGFIKMMDQTDSLVGPINLGNPNEFTMLELAEKVLKRTRSKSKLRFEALPEDDPKQRQPDITKARLQLGWAPKIQLEEGLESSIEDFEART
jgi:UDP-glucuronate decarboxylase